ncbi:MAG: hypothetical protein ACRDTC_06080 [Pseudonocardiaceae bacterium]
MRRRPHHYPHRIGQARGAVSPLLLVTGALLLAGSAVLFAMMIAVLLPLTLAGVTAIAIVSSRHRKRMEWRRHRVMPAAQPTASVAPQLRSRQRSEWSAARARFDQLRSEYGQFECDPLAVLRLPALSDVTVPSTGRFVDAFAEAQALDTDTEPPPSHQTRFTAAVDQAWRAWRAALDAAERIRLAGIPAEERATVQRAIKLLTMARDSDHDAERTAAYARARTELAKLDRSGTLRLPPAAAAALDAASRGQLPPGPNRP